MDEKREINSIHTEEFLQQEQDEIDIFIERDIMQTARIPKEFWQCSVDNFNFGRLKKFQINDLNLSRLNGQNRKLRYLQFNQNNNILYTGDIGVGKTHLAVARQLHYINKNPYRATKSLFVYQPDLNDSIRSTFSDDPEIYKKAWLYEDCFRITHLLLDDLGKLVKNPIVIEKTTHLLEYRIHNKLRTDITLNFTDEEFLKIGFSASLLDRIKGYFIVVVMEGESYRGDRKIDNIS